MRANTIDDPSASFGTELSAEVLMAVHGGSFWNDVGSFFEEVGEGMVEAGRWVIDHLDEAEHILKLGERIYDIGQELEIF